MRAIIVFLFLSLHVSIYSQSFADMGKDHGKPSSSYRSFTENGSWCWFSDPRAIYYEGRFKRTYAGWIDSNGNVTVGYYDHGSGEIRTEILAEKYEVDDHDNPALLFRPDGHLMVFFTKHGGPDPTLMFTMNNPEDIDSWDKQELFLNDMETYKEFTNTNTYVDPVMLSDEGNRIYLFWRGTDNKPNFSCSDDLGKTWTKGRIFVLPERIYSMRRPYMKVESNGKDRIFFAFTDGHPNNEKENSIYFMYYKKGSFYNIKGEKIGEPGDVPVNPRAATVVYDATITKEKSWIWDIAFDRHENPVLVYARFPDNSNHIYTYSRWSGIKWITTDLVNSGAWFPSDQVREQNYSGGLVLDHENPGTVYMSVKRGPHFEIEKWVTRNGSDWRHEAVTTNSDRDNVRPFAVRKADKNNPLQLLWMENEFYVHYTDYKSIIKMNIKEIK